MRRRDLLKAAGAGAAALAAPGLVLAQTPGVPLVAWLSVAGSENPMWQDLLVRGLATEGLLLGRDLRLAFVHVENAGPAIAAGVEEILALGPDLIIVDGTSRAEAVLAATTTIPVVFNNVDDPGRLVANLSRPEGNATGFWIGDRPVGQRIETLRMVVPNLERVIYLYHVRDEHPDRIASYEEGTSAAGLAFAPVGVAEPGQIAMALSPFAGEPGTGILVSAGGMLYRDRTAVIRPVNATRIPAGYFWSQYAQEGGLMAIAPDIYDPIRSTGIYVGRILNGLPIADLPVQPVTKVQLTLNLAAARSQGITIPAALIELADEIIG